MTGLYRHGEAVPIKKKVYLEIFLTFHFGNNTMWVDFD